MRVRPIDADGDMMPIMSNSQLLDGSKAVVQIARDRLKFYRGDWWENPSRGIRIPDFLLETIRKRDVQFFTRYMTSFIAGTPGVTGITGVMVSFEKRKLTFSCYLQTKEGTEPLEVDMSGLL